MVCESNCLVLGGSQGATQLNEMFARLLKQMDAKSPYAHFKWTIQCGQANLKSGELWELSQSQDYPQLELLGYTSKIEEYYRKADLLVCRSGAGVLAEALCFALPMILLPYPYSTDDHQKANAKNLSEAGAAILLDQKDSDITELHRHLERLVQTPQALVNMQKATHLLARPNAAIEIARDIIGDLL